MKIFDFLKENKIGAIIGGLYALIVAIGTIFGIFDNANPLFLIISLPADFLQFGFLVPVFHSFFKVEIVFFVFASIISLFFWVINGAYAQKFVRNQSRQSRIILGFFFVILAIIIFLISYFGILGEGDSLSICIFASDFPCIDYKISATDGEFKLRLKNNVGELIDVSSITLSTEYTDAYTCTTPPAMPTEWQSGTIKELVWAGCTGGRIVAGSKGKILINIKYYNTTAGSAFTKEVKGEVFSGVR